MTFLNCQKWLSCATTVQPTPHHIQHFLNKITDQLNKVEVLTDLLHKTNTRCFGFHGGCNAAFALPSWPYVVGLPGSEHN